MKTAIVTGAGSGIGREAARSLAGAGYRVVLAGRRAEQLEETARLVQEGNSMVVPTDVTNEEQVVSLFDNTVDSWGRLDVLFNNAGTNIPAIPMDEVTAEQWRGVVEVNLTGVFLCTREAFRIMRNQNPMGGRIINNGSISAHAPRPRSIAYTATKHAITGMTKTTSLDGRPYDIVCSQIDIGNAATEMTAKMKDGVPQADGSKKPEPVMNVENVGKAVVFMAGLPLDANVQFMTVMATKMPFVGRG